MNNILNDYIVLKKLSYDSYYEELGKYKVVFSSQSITASNNIFMSDETIDNLIFGLNRFIDKQIDEVYWSTGEKGEKTTACAALHFFRKNKAGHILIEAFLELDDGGKYSEHNCCFYINTEEGMLVSFCEKLPCLKNKTNGVEVVLNKFKTD